MNGLSKKFDYIDDNFDIWPNQLKQMLYGN